ncbi:MAG: MFS transporter [Solirubrobacteraceae bacterium]
MCHLRLRIFHHRHLTKSRRAHVRLVVPRGCRCGADLARDRRAGFVQLLACRTAARVRVGCLSGPTQRPRLGCGSTGLTSFFFQYLPQAGLLFAVPLFLSVALGLSAIDSGVRLLPFSITLLLAAAGIPKVFPNASPRRVVQLGFLALFAGIVVMVAALDAGAGPEIVTWPVLLAGLGVGELASQLGAVTVSSVPDQQSGEVGGLQNTVTNLGASIGTARSAHRHPHHVIYDRHSEQSRGARRSQVQSQGRTGRRRPIRLRRRPETALEKAGVSTQAANAIVSENTTARIDGLRSSLSVMAVIALIAVFFSLRIPTEQSASATET